MNFSDYPALNQTKRSSKWRSDLLLIRENIRWMEKIGALQFGFGFSLQFITVLQLMLDTGQTKDTLRPFISLCLLLCGLCVIVCGFLSRGIRMWGTCGYTYACLLANCMCLGALLLPLGFVHSSASLMTLVSQRRLNITMLEIDSRSDKYISYVNSYMLMYFMANTLLSISVVLCSLQAHLCCITVNFRERDLCFASMFVKFGLGLFQWINRFVK